MRPVSLSEPTQPESLLPLAACAWQWQPGAGPLYDVTVLGPGHRVTRLLAVRLSSYTVRTFENRDTFDVRIIEPVSIYVVSRDGRFDVFHRRIC
jgi:hypothetical protein